MSSFSSRLTAPGGWQRLARWLSAGRAANQLGWLVAGLGVLLRLVVWWQARSVYLDEVALLRNFLERDYGRLFQPLGYRQYAPPLFSVLTKAVVGLCGTSELAIRLVPLAASCAMLVLFRQLAGRWLPAWWAALAVGTVAFSSLYLDFATVCKQYSTDSLVAVVLLLLAERQVRRPRFSRRAALGWAGLGAVLVWASMPAVFVLAGVGLALAWTYRAQPSLATSGWLLLVGSAWALSFLGYFTLLLRADAQSSYLQNYHHDAFLAFPPRSAADWSLLGSQLGGLADKGFGKTGLAMALAAVGFLVGTARLLRRPQARTWLLLVPLFACLAASAISYYSLLPRLMVFWLPLALLVVLLGLSTLSQRRPAINLLLLVAAGLVLGEQQRLRFFVVPFQADYADVRGALAYVAARQRPDDVVFAYRNLEQPAYYYAYLRPLPWPLSHPVLETYRYTPHDDQIAQDLKALIAAGHRRIWLVYDLPDPWLLNLARQHGRVSQVAQFYLGYAFLLEIP